MQQERPSYKYFIERPTTVDCTKERPSFNCFHKVIIEAEGSGEEIEAAVTLSEPVTEAEILAYCRERLAEFKRPKKIHIVTEIPRTATGKIQRRAVAAAFAGPRG